MKRLIENGADVYFQQKADNVKFGALTHTDLLAGAEDGHFYYLVNPH